VTFGDWDDAEYAREMVEQDPRNFQHCSERLKDDERFARWAIEEHDVDFEYCSERLRNDFAFAMWVVEKYVYRLRTDPVFCAFLDLVASEESRPRIDLPASLRAAYDTTQMFYPEGNGPEFRKAFLTIARAPKPDPDVPLPTHVEHPEVFDSLSFERGFAP
jgi:hypothetical protein